MSLLFRACFAFLIAFAAVQPQALASVFGTRAIASVKADLAEAERAEAARSHFDAAIFRAAAALRATVRTHTSQN
jgi:hypothetical protein